MAKERKRRLLKLGWQVAPGGAPRYWLKKDAEVGGAADSYMVQCAAEDIGTHTAIIAQSGSGKSFFLGMLIEELLLRTEARCVVFDPNSDFRRIYDVRPAAELWRIAGYDVERASGELPIDDRPTFAKQWEKLSIATFRGDIDVESAHQKKLKLWWPDVSAEVLTAGLESAREQVGLRLLHSFVQHIEPLLAFRAASQNLDTLDHMKEAEALAKEMSADVKAALEEKFNPEALAHVDLAAVAKVARPGISESYRFQKAADPTSIESLLRTELKAATLALSHVREQAFINHYFERVEEYRQTGILTSEPPSSYPDPHRLRVFDLPSVHERARLVVVSGILNAVWQSVRQDLRMIADATIPDTRVPTFIVVDEAHNLIPLEPRTAEERAVLEQFRTIVAEGRKYGLFLILATQRPDKVDKLVLSECENKVLMRLSTPAVLQMTKHSLGLEHLSDRMLSQCLEFGLGRALLVGRWARDGMFVYGAARRTVEGGAGLKAKSWAFMEVDEDDARWAAKEANEGLKKDKKA